MADYDTNLIKPVQGLQNVAGLAPAKRRKDRNRRRQSHEKGKERNELAEDAEAALPQERAEDKDEKDGGGIDYCA
jgi:hypothetical protein